jgi:hypothetical protein
LGCHWLACAFPERVETRRLGRAMAQRCITAPEM